MEDAGAIAALINRAYRGESSRMGWTSEADLFDGPRTDENEVQSLISSDGSMMLLCIQGEKTIGSVLLKNMGSTAYLGMLVTDPRIQGSGIGSRLMLAAEVVARERFAARKISITVIRCRHELILFYERRGYRRTGEVQPLHTHGLSVPRVADLELEVMEKEVGE